MASRVSFNASKVRIGLFNQQREVEIDAMLAVCLDQQLSEDAAAVPVQDGVLVLVVKAANPRRKRLQKKNISSSTAV